MWLWKLVEFYPDRGQTCRFVFPTGSKSKIFWLCPMHLLNQLTFFFLLQEMALRNVSERANKRRLGRGKIWRMNKNKGKNNLLVHKQQIFFVLCYCCNRTCSYFVIVVSFSKRMDVLCLCKNLCVNECCFSQVLFRVHWRGRRRKTD